MAHTTKWDTNHIKFICWSWRFWNLSVVGCELHRSIPFLARWRFLQLPCLEWRLWQIMGNQHVGTCRRLVLSALLWHRGPKPEIQIQCDMFRNLGCPLKTLGLVSLPCFPGTSTSPPKRFFTSLNFGRASTSRLPRYLKSSSCTWQLTKLWQKKKSWLENIFLKFMGMVSANMFAWSPPCQCWGRWDRTGLGRQALQMPKTPACQSTRGPNPIGKKKPWPLCCGHHQIDKMTHGKKRMENMGLNSLRVLTGDVSK